MKIERIPGYGKLSFCWRLATFYGWLFEFSHGKRVHSGFRGSSFTGCKFSNYVCLSGNSLLVNLWLRLVSSFHCNHPNGQLNDVSTLWNFRKFKLNIHIFWIEVKEGRWFTIFSTRDLETERNFACAFPYYLQLLKSAHGSWNVLYLKKNCDWGASTLK